MAESCLQMKPYSLTKLSVAWVATGIGLGPVFVPFEYTLYRYRSVGNDPSRMVPLLAVTTVFAMLALRSFWKRALMVLTTVPLVIGCNVLRLVVVILVSQAYDPASGLWVHEWFGFVTYLLAIVAMSAMAHWLREKPSPSGA